MSIFHSAASPLPCTWLPPAARGAVWGKLSRTDYEHDRAAIRETYGDSSQQAGAKRDQALAKLFYRSGWMQEELAKVEGVTQKTISQRLLFGRFLNFIPAGINLETAHFKLTEGAFQRNWKRIDKNETNERIRFGAVRRLIEDYVPHAA